MGVLKRFLPQIFTIITEARRGWKLYRPRKFYLQNYAFEQNFAKPQNICPLKILGCNYDIPGDSYHLWTFAMPLSQYAPSYNINVIICYQLYEFISGTVLTKQSMGTCVIAEALVKITIVRNICGQVSACYHIHHLILAQ